MTKALPQVPFENSYLYATIETGKSPSEDRPASLGLIISDNAAATLVQIKAGGLCIYADVATARSLATQIIRLTDDGDLLWDTEPMTGEEVDRWTEDIRAGAIGGDPS